jgi:hypothetical protein
MKKIIGLTMVVVMLVAPVLVNAQIGIPPMKHPKEQAVKDAKGDVNHFVWFGAGLLLGPIGLGISYVTQPAPPPADRLMGKSDVYITEYRATYKKAKKALQENDALAGCIPSTLVWFSIIFLATRSDETN